jgi:hypothetical protein
MTWEDLLKNLLELLEEREWSHHNAAENTYCLDCMTEDERWDDQISHHDGCEFVAVVKAARRMLSSLSCGRCGDKLLPDEAESCWYCIGSLCFHCWDTYGHCGHVAADKFNENARKSYAETKPEPSKLCRICKAHIIVPEMIAGGGLCYKCPLGHWWYEPSQIATEDQDG